MLTAFAIGYFPAQRRADQDRDASAEAQRALDSKLRESEADYKIASLHAELGMVLIEVEENNYGRARERASRFFDRLRDAIPSIPSSRVERLKALLAKRDEVTADLATSNPGTAAKLRKLYFEYGGGGEKPAESK